MPRRTGRDPATGKTMLDGITAIVSDRTSAVSYQCRWSWTSPLGERVFGSKIFKDLFQAETYLLETRLAIRRGSLREPDRITVAAYAERWLDRKAHVWAPSTQHGRRATWTRLIAPALGDLRLTSLTRGHCQELVDDLNRRGLAPGSVRSHVQMLSGMLEAAVADGVIDRNVARNLILPTLHRDEQTLWTADQVRAFLASVKDAPLYPMWVLQVTCGLRIGEALALTWRDIDLDAGFVTIRRTVQRRADGSQGVAERTKTRQQRIVPLAPPVIVTLRAHHHGQACRLSAVVDLRDFVFPRADGTPRLYSATLLSLRRAIARAGLSPVPATVRNPLRHMTATLLAEQGAHPVVAQRILGHRSPLMTLERYTHVSGRQASEALNALANSVLEGATTSPLDEVEETGAV